LARPHSTGFLFSRHRRMAETIRSTRDFLGDVRTELEKVTWPDWPQLKNSTGVIIAFVVILAIIIFAMDQVSTLLVQVLDSLLGV
jgi:preprotein translocase subunit SecE